MVRAGLFLVLVLCFQGVAGPAGADEPPAVPFEQSTFVEVDGDFVSEVQHDDSGYDLASSASINDPYGDDPWAAYLPIVAAPEGKHYWEVWSCNETDDGPPTLSPAEFIAVFGPAATNWFMQVSEGRYSPQFVAGGSYSADRCLYEAPSVPANRGIIAITGGSGGLGGPGSLVISQSGVRHIGPRRAQIGSIGFPPGGDVDDAPWILDILVHEIGHGLGWPHVPAVGSGGHYNNPADVMSGGRMVAGVPVPTAAFNAYASGWIDPTELLVWEKGTTSVRLGTPLSSRSQMVMVPSDTQGRFHTISVTPTSVESSAPQGVVVHLVDQTWSDSVGYCVYQQACFLGSHHMEALVPPGATQEYGLIDPILEPGDTLDVGSWKLSVMAAHSDGFTIEIAGDGARLPGIAATGSFTDVPVDHIFANAIFAMADAGITNGCNPPDNTRFCPDDFVTRGQMAAFITRAVGLAAYDGPDRFTDDDGHTFENAIERLAQAGITNGCNPGKGNTRFCPDDQVSRGQMAAFMVRSLGLPAYDGPNRFTDDDGHTFENAIERLAQAGITNGCNPPDNTRFCPDDFVTRAQMAAFMIRAGMAD